MLSLLLFFINIRNDTVKNRVLKNRFTETINKKLFKFIAVFEEINWSFQNLSL